MVQLKVEFTGESYRTLSRLERKTPITFRYAQKAAAKHAQNKLKAVLREGGGCEGVPGYAGHSELTRVKLGRSKRVGGVLANARQIVRFKRGEGWVVGWPDALAGWAGGWQRAESYPFTEAQKAALHREYRTLDGFHIPSYYDRPARPIIAPFTNMLKGWFPGEVVSQFNNQFNKLMSEGKIAR